MRADRIVVGDPAPGQNLCFVHVAKQLAIEELVAHPGVETFAIAIFPRTAGLDVGRDHTDTGKPFADLVGSELAAIVAAQVLGTPPGHHQVRKNLNNAAAFPAAARQRGQALPGKFVNDVQPPDLPAVHGLVLDEVIAPDMVPALRTKADAAAIRKPEPALLALLDRQLQAFLPPDALDPFVVDLAPAVSDQARYLAIADPSEIAGLVNDLGTQLILIGPFHRFVAIGSSIDA